MLSRGLKTQTSCRYPSNFDNKAVHAKVLPNVCTDPYCWLVNILANVLVTLYKLVKALEHVPPEDQG